jgi:hypothetical protein
MMTTLAHEHSVRRPQLVDALLTRIEETRQRVYAAQANGVRPAGLRDLKDELRRLRTELAALTSRVS